MRTAFALATLSSTIEGARKAGSGGITIAKQPQRGSSQRTGTNRCDDTVQDNCVVGDSQAAECKEFLASSDTSLSWTTATRTDAQIKCKDENGRLMKIASLSDLARLGADVKYDGHMVALDLFGPDGVTAGTDWNSYDEIADAEVWEASQPGDGTTEQCAAVTSSPSVNTFVNYLTTDTDCTVAGNFICERHVQTTLMACNHWMCPIVGGDVFVDQNFDTTTDMTTLADQTFSFHKLQIDDGSYTDTGNEDGNDDGIHTGTVDGNTITITGEGHNGDDWIGKIYKATPGFCVQETLDAYCRYLGLTDWEIVLNESADCEDRSFARFKDNKWGCYSTIGTTDAMECVDDTGAVTVNCPQPDAPDTTCATDEIHLEMKRLVDEVTECGCKRPDLIEFSAPAQTLIRCTEGCVPGWKWDRPSYANLCEEIGYTKHYDCKLVGTLTVLSTTASVATYPECATACDNDATCSGINYNEVTLDCELLGPLAEDVDFFAKTTDLECTDPDKLDDSGNPAPIANDDWIAGRKCKEMSEADALNHARTMDDLTVRPYICEHCDQHQFTTHEGCIFTGAEIAEADGGLHKHVMTYKDCIALCTANSNCGGVTYYTRHWAAGESGDTGPMYCQLHGTITTDPECSPMNPYDEVRSGIPCTDEPICVDQLCHTCPTSEWTKEKDCMHTGTLLDTPSHTSYDACRDACIALDTCELFTWHTADTLGGPNARAANDCELFSDDVAMSRLCDPTITKGVITGRTCQNEERCQMGCGGFNECTGDAVNAASHNCADTAGTSCSDTAGGFTCDHSAASLGLVTDGSASYDGHAAGMTTDASGNLIIGGATASISGSTISVANTGATASTHPVLTGTVDASGNIAWSDGTTSAKTDSSTTTDTSGTDTTGTTGTDTTGTTGTDTTGTTGTDTTGTTGTDTTGTTGTTGTDTTGTTGTGTTGTSGTETGTSSYTPGTSASATGDPHFKIAFPYEMKDICFDLDGPNGKIFNLVHDPTTGLVINAQVTDHGFGHHHADRLSSIGVISPNGNKVIFSTTGITGHGPEGTVTLSYENDEVYNFGDIDISVHNRAQFRHSGATFTVDDSVFELSIKEAKDSIKFYIDSEAHSDHNLDGLLGFTLAHSYNVLNETTLLINNEQMEYNLDHFENCLRLTDSSIRMKLAKHQLAEDYLLGVPFEVAFLGADDQSPK